MDATSIITQVSRDDEQQLNSSYPGEKVNNVDRLKPPKRGFFETIFCCWRNARTKSNQNGTPIDGSITPPPIQGQPRYLLPQVRHSDMHRKCMVIDLDETLVHSSFKVSAALNRAVNQFDHRRLKGIHYRLKVCVTPWYF
nr:CTD small phosphatase-like protein [Aedes albopictus]XP_029731225.1 CTD small phosphatase-like protein [Aedes albopictus]XP_029731226.1 CTD small phosphatase-like protein [Aedes albopictus]XP_029731227.1 CTD small phosphatase-like protein [Aedes albopictus]